MKVIAHDLGDFDEIFLLPLADWHIGDPASDGKRITEWLDYLKKTPNAFALLNGDLMNCAIRNSVSDVYTDLSPMEQLKQCVKLFEPIKEKLLAVTPGNHELRIYKNDGLDLTQIMCDQLGIGERYSPASVLLFIRFGKWRRSGRHGEPVRYSVYAVHGTGAGRTEGGEGQPTYAACLDSRRRRLHPFSSAYSRNCKNVFLPYITSERNGRPSRQAIRQHSRRAQLWRIR